MQREHLSIYLTHDDSARHRLRLIDVSHQEERLRAFFAIYKGMYGVVARRGADLRAAHQPRGTAACRLAEAFEFVQLGKADRLLVESLQRRSDRKKGTAKCAQETGS